MSNINKQFRHSLARVVAAAVAFAVLTSFAYGQDRRSLGYRFALTKQDAICEGVLVDCGSNYSVEFSGGGSIMISKLDVVFIGSSRAEIYEYKKSHTRLEDVNEILKLADWSSRRGLTNEALATLESALAQSQDAAERSALIKKADDLREAERFREEAARARSEAEARARASSTVARPTERRNKMTEDERALDAWGDALPYSELERFARKAAPVLTKRCALAECHSEASQGATYRLRPKAIGAAQRLALLYNLRETTRFVRFDALEQSELLNHPEILDARGNRVYPFGNDRNSVKDCDAFLAWLNELKSDSKLAQLASQYRLERSSVPTLRDAPASRYDYASNAQERANELGATNEPEAQDFNELFAQQNAGVQSPTANAQSQADGQLPDVFQQGFAPETVRLAREPQEDVNSPEAALRRANLIPQKRYRDEFDPDIFNDRYHPDKK